MTNLKKCILLCHLFWSILATKDTVLDKARMTTDLEGLGCTEEGVMGYKSPLPLKEVTLIYTGETNALQTQQGHWLCHKPQIH